MRYGLWVKGYGIWIMGYEFRFGDLGCRV